MTSSYILCRCRSGLNDCFNQLWKVTLYAKRMNREILFEMPSYSASDLSKIFDFSKFPVPIHTNTNSYIQKFRSSGNVYPQSYINFLQNKDECPSENIQMTDDIQVSKDTLIVHDSTGGGSSGNLIFRYLRFQPDFLKEFYNRYSLPPVYDAIHVRNTDLCINTTKFDSIVSKFVKDADGKPIFIISDDQNTVKLCIEKYGCRKTYTEFLDGVNLHSHGFRNCNILKDAIHDLLILIKSRNFLPVPIEKNGEVLLSGFSILAKDLHSQKSSVKEVCKLQRERPSIIY
jgi:hypothetical protein